MIVGHALPDSFDGLAAEQIVHRVEVIADRAGVRHRIDQSELIGHFCQLSVHLIDAHPWDLGSDRAVGPANAGGCVGLHIPSIHLAGTATQQDEDT